MSATEVPAAPRVPLADIHVHPANPRRNAVADDAMVESIKQLDLLQPVTIAPAPDGDGWTLIDGHRRLDGAECAGLPDVPVHVRADLVTEAQQIEAMAVTGLQHENLSPVEEAAAYEQLALLGMDAAAISEATGFSVARVKRRLDLNVLSEDAKNTLHAGDATLADVEALMEFADDPEISASLEEALGTANFAHTVQLARRRRERAERVATTIREWEAAGAVRVTMVPGAAGKVVVAGDERGEERRAYGLYNFPEALRDPAAHDGCLGWEIGDYEWAEPRRLCFNPARHAEHTDTEADARRAHEESEWEARRAEREAKLEQARAAHATRIAWLVDHFTGMFPTKSHQPLAAAAKAVLPLLVVDDREALDSTTLLTALGVTVDQQSYQAQIDAKAAYVVDLPDRKPTAVLAVFAQYLAALVADQFQSEPGYLDEVNDVLQQLALWDWIKAAGYTLSDADRELRTRCEIRLTEVTDGADEAEAS